MNAKQAREIAESQLSISAQKQYNSIKHKIEIAAKNGDTQMHTYDELIKGVKRKLTEEGFTVDDTMDRNEICNTIYW